MVRQAARAASAGVPRVVCTVLWVCSCTCTGRRGVVQSQCPRAVSVGLERGYRMYNLFGLCESLLNGQCGTCTMTILGAVVYVFLLHGKYRSVPTGAPSSPLMRVMAQCAIHGAIRYCSTDVLNTRQVQNQPFHSFLSSTVIGRRQDARTLERCSIILRRASKLNDYVSHHVMHVMTTLTRTDCSHVQWRRAESELSAVCLRFLTPHTSQNG